MQRLAFKFKINRLKNRLHSLLDYGIIYRQFNSQMLINNHDSCDAIATLFTHINNDLSNLNISNATVLLDGFDEVADLLVEDSKIVFEELIRQIQGLVNEHSQTNKLNKIIISLRPEIFDNGIFVLNDLNISKLIFEVNKLTEDQAQSMYKKVSVQSGEKRSTRKKNLTRLKGIMNNSNDADSVFAYPFIMEWAPELFAEFSDDDKLNEQNLYLILDTIINPLNVKKKS